MKEIEKLQTGAYYRMDDAEIAEIQNRAIALCQKIDTVSVFDNSVREELFRKLFGSVGKIRASNPVSDAIWVSISISEIIFSQIIM